MNKKIIFENIWYQKELTFQKPRGFHLITKEVISALPEIKTLKMGILHLFIQHTSAGLTINENCDGDVLKDLHSSFNRIVPEDDSLYKHTDEGSDDAPSHVKSTLAGSSLSIPIGEGKLLFGTWQGIVLCEFRNGKKTRNVIATLSGCVEKEE